MAKRFAPACDTARTRTARHLLGVAVLTVLAVAPAADAGPALQRVKGFFCNAKGDSIAFLQQKARGENEEMAANAVNKSVATSSCAYYIPATAVHTGEHTVIEDGLVYKLESYMFLPEKVERWRGTVFGSLGSSTPAPADI
jgi:hypothetical protein